MKILLLSPNQISRKNWTHQLFRNQIGKHHDVTYYGEGYPKYVFDKPIKEVIKDFNTSYDLILTYGLKYTEPFVGLSEIINIPKVHIAVDYFADSTSGTYERNHKMFNRDKYDLYFGTCGHVVRNLIANKVCDKAFVLPFSIDIDIYKKMEIKKCYDVFAVFNTNTTVYPYREEIQKTICKISKIKPFIKPVKHEDYIRAINASRICVTSNNKFKSFSIKYTEILSCGSFLLADKPEDFDELGYINKKHLVIYENIDDLKEKISYYLSHEKERELIEKNGMNFVREFHNNDIRINQFTKVIKENLGIS